MEVIIGIKSKKVWNMEKKLKKIKVEVNEYLEKKDNEFKKDMVSDDLNKEVMDFEENIKR